MESKIISFCKANLLSSKLEKKTFNLVQVLYKTEARNEYSHFLFATETGSNMKANGHEFNSKLLFRVCVPVDRKFNSYVDFKCPYSSCSDYETSKTCRNNPEFKENHSLSNTNSNSVMTNYKHIIA